MTPQKLKNSILQLAIQGKLVEQRAEEGTAAELLEKILATKNAKSAKKNLTRSRGVRGAGEGMRGLSHLPKAALTLHGTHSATSASPREKIPDDEKPFDIPENWEWVRLGKVFQHNTGKALNSSDKTGTPLSYITTSNVYWNRFELGKLKTMLFSESEVEKCTIQKGDLLVLEGGDVGRAAIWNYDFPMRIQNHIHRLRPLIDICVQYVYYIFMLYKNANMISGKGISIKGLSANALHNLLIPLPPLAEQKRIVAKIEELLPLIDRYEKAWSKLEDFNKRFPVDMQKSLLQLAIQGKLVEQRPEEGTAAELLEKIFAAKNAKGVKKNLTQSRRARGEKATAAPSVSPRDKISDDEKPFDIPESWEWVRLYEIADSIQYGYSAPARQSGRIRMVRISDIQNGKINWNTVPFCDIAEKDVERYLVEAGDVLFARTGGTVGKSYLVRDTPQESIYAGYLIRTRFLSCVLPQFAKIFFESDIYWKQLKSGLVATAQPNFNGKKLASMRIPLPPLAEQKRIVAKLEELLPLCERLK